jgi:hypothetical protein
MRACAGRQRRAAAFALGALLAVAAAAQEQPGGVRRGAQSVPATPGHVELERLNRRTEEAAKAPPETPTADVPNAFASTSWYVPPPPPKPGPPPKPVAPPLPFTFMGRYDDAAKAVVMLVKGDRLYTVSVGDVIDGTYRIDRITDRSIELIYLPLNEKQALPTGGA